MRPYIDEIGNRYGKLIVIGKSDKKFKGRTDAAWVCQCDCGNISIVSGGILRRSMTRSCGCSKETNKLGNRYKKLLVIEKDKLKKGYWICQCDCGNKISIKTASLQPNGGIGSCGCLENIISVNPRDKFGKLTVIKKIQDSTNIWECFCECGKTVKVKGFSLVSGNRKSCGRGCYVKKNLGDASFNMMYGTMIKGARNRGYIWDLNKEQVKTVTSKNCFYCGCKPSQGESSGKRLNGAYIYNGIDRINNDEGYTIRNIVPCCWKCNRAKATMNIKEFKQWIISVYEHIH